MKHLLMIASLVFLVRPAFAAQITIVADYDHEGAQARNSAIDVLQQASGRHPCALVEVPPNFNLAMRNYMYRRADYNRTVGVEIARYERAIGYNFQNVVPAWFLSQAAQLKARVIGVDFTEGSSMAKRFRAVWRRIAPHMNHLETAPRADLQQFVKTLENRNQIMAANAARAISSGACDDAVLVIGEGHFRNEVMGLSVRSLQNELARRGVSVSH